MPEWSRRELLALPFAAAAAGAPAQNVSYLLRDLPGTITLAEMFFVRDHFEEPELSLRSWTLSIEGRVARRREWTISDMIEAPRTKVEALLECAGNAPNGASVANAVWEGVSLARLLDEARTTPDATRVLLEAADEGRLREGSPKLPYCQIVPIEDCRRSESIVAFRMNEKLLPRRNGFPARAVFPGLYAMNSVKWLRRIVVLGPGDDEAAFSSSGMNRLYTRYVRGPQGEEARERVAEIQVKSVIASPGALPGETARLPAGRHAIWGFAWTGHGLVRGVDLSVDGGKSWRAATFEGAPRRHSWVRWRYAWDAAPGDYQLLSRATDDAGRAQPVSRQPDRIDAYELNTSAVVRCSVR